MRQTPWPRRSSARDVSPRRNERRKSARRGGGGGCRVSRRARAPVVMAVGVRETYLAVLCLLAGELGDAQRREHRSQHVVEGRRLFPGLGVHDRVSFPVGALGDLRHGDGRAREAARRLRDARSAEGDLNPRSPGGGSAGEASGACSSARRLCRCERRRRRKKAAGSFSKVRGDESSASFPWLLRSYLYDMSK